MQKPHNPQAAASISRSGIPMPSASASAAVATTRSTDSDTDTDTYHSDTDERKAKAKAVRRERKRLARGHGGGGTVQIGDITAKVNLQFAAKTPSSAAVNTVPVLPSVGGSDSTHPAVVNLTLPAAKMSILDPSPTRSSLYEDDVKTAKPTSPKHPSMAIPRPKLYCGVILILLSSYILAYLRYGRSQPTQLTKIKVNTTETSPTHFNLSYLLPSETWILEKDRKGMTPLILPWTASLTEICPLTITNTTTLIVKEVQDLCTNLTSALNTTDSTYQTYWSKGQSMSNSWYTKLTLLIQRLNDPLITADQKLLDISNFGTSVRAQLSSFSGHAQHYLTSLDTSRGFLQQLGKVARAEFTTASAADLNRHRAFCYAFRSTHALIQDGEQYRTQMDAYQAMDCAQAGLQEDLRRFIVEIESLLRGLKGIEADLSEEMLFIETEPGTVVYGASAIVALAVKAWEKVA